jgi:hypothetical protein
VLAFGIGVMINRDSRGHSYYIVRGEILGFMKNEQLFFLVMANKKKKVRPPKS